MATSKKILNERKRNEKNKKKVRKSVKFVDTKQKKRWIGWRDSEEPSEVVTYQLSDLEKNEKA